MISTNHPTVYKPREWETVACPFCGSADSSLYERYGSEMQYTYVICNHCKLVYQSPRPKYDQEFIDAAYASYYQFTETLDLNSKPDVPESSVKMFQKEVEYLLQFDKKRTAVLDIGSGMGTFLVAAKPYYQEAVGLDVSAQMAAFVEKQLGVKVLLEQFENSLAAQRGGYGRTAENDQLSFFLGECVDTRPKIAQRFFDSFRCVVGDSQHGRKLHDVKGHQPVELITSAAGAPFVGARMNHAVTKSG